MSSKWLLPRLKNRIQIVKPTQTPNDDGGFDRGYTTLLTVWGELKPSVYKVSAAEYIRGVQTNEQVTHKVAIRKSSVSSLGRTFSTAFSIAFDSIADINLLKSDMFLFVQMDSMVKGRLFRIHNIVDVQERGYYYSLMVEEIEEKGTGYPV